MNDIDKNINPLLVEIERLRKENIELKTSRDELKRAEEELRILHEAAFEGIMIHEKGTLLKANAQYFKMFGYSPLELIGRQVIPLTIIPETLDFEKRKITDDGVTTYEIQGVRKDGSNFLMEIRGKLMEYQGRKVRGVAMMDITEQKKVEEALRESEKMLRFLSSRLFEVQENERSRLSRELHDQLGHDLALLKSRLIAIHRNIEENRAELKTDCKNAIDAVSEAIENVRRISRDLMPPTLEDLGLCTSIHCLIENFACQNKIRICFEMADIDHLFPHDTKINLYRIFQESLTNISRHSNATEVTLLIKLEGNHVICSIRDNGKGFELNKVMEKKFDTRSIGLTAMKERIGMLGGKLEIHTRLGEGTEIIFKVPVGERR